MADVTHILQSIESGDPHAGEQLLPLVYDELRKLAAAKIAAEKPGQTLQATALVHEAYVRLVETPANREPEASPGRQSGESPGRHWNSRGHFFAAAGEAMRRILVDRARAKQSAKRGGALNRLDVDDVDPADESNAELVLAINEALEHLASEDERLASLVKLRFFAGFTLDEASQALGVHRSTAIDDWAYAKTRLRMLLDTAE